VRRPPTNIVRGPSEARVASFSVLFPLSHPLTAWTTRALAGLPASRANSGNNRHRQRLEVRTLARGPRRDRARRILIETRIGGFRYRVGLEERALAALGAATVIRVADDGDTEGALHGYRL
jgi:hypothetical protein